MRANFVGNNVARVGNFEVPIHSVTPDRVCALHAFGSRVHFARRGAEDAEGMQLDKSRSCRAKTRHL